MATPEEILKEAALTVSNRGTDNGYDAGQERSAGKVAAIYNVLKDAELTEKDIWLIQIILKLVRNSRKERNDNIIDLAGYVSLLGESQWVKPENNESHECFDLVRPKKVHIVELVRRLLNRPKGWVYYIEGLQDGSWLKITRVEGRIEAGVFHRQIPGRVYCGETEGVSINISVGQYYLAESPEGKKEYFEVIA